MVYLKSVEKVITLGKLIGLLFLFCHPLLSILFLVYIYVHVHMYMYICACVCRGPKSVGGITWAKCAHAQSQFWVVKSDQ